MRQLVDTQDAGSGLRIVLIDDNDDIRETIAGLLRRAGHEIVAHADNGDRGVERALAERPDLVITDWRMPAIDGIEVTRRIRAANPSIAVIAFCSTEEPQVHAAFIRAGATAAVDKRDFRRLMAAVRAVGTGMSTVSD